MYEISLVAHTCPCSIRGKDFLNILVPYFIAGFENSEFCIWVVADPVSVEEARDDEGMLMDLLATFLEAKSYRILKAKDREEAVQIYRKSCYSIDPIITNIGLPKRDGHSAFFMMKELNPDVNVVIASAFAEQQAAILRAGVKDILAKPYVPDQVLRSVPKE